MSPIVFLLTVMQFKTVRLIQVTTSIKNYPSLTPLVSVIVRGHNSPKRDFYVKVVRFGNDDDATFGCSGTLVDSEWVLTAAHCVCSSCSENILVQLGDYTDINGPRKIALVSAIRCHPQYEDSLVLNDIALIRLRERITSYTFLPLCEALVDPRRVLAACGMGAVTSDDNEMSDVLQETFFLEERGGWILDRCRVDNICTISLTENSSIGNGDSGGPLYLLSAHGREAVCLYGVSSYVQESHWYNTERSYFASVPHSYTWLRATMDHNRKIKPFFAPWSR